MAKAKELIAEANPSDTRHHGLDRQRKPQQRSGRLLRRTCSKKLGFNAKLKIINADNYFTMIGNASTPDLDTGWVNWFQDYPHPNDFFQPLLAGESILPTNNSNFAHIDDPKLNAKIAKLGEEPLGPEQEAEYAELDKEFMEQAPWAPYGSERCLDLRLQRNRPRQGDLQPDLRPGPDQLPVQVAAGRLLHNRRVAAELQPSRRRRGRAAAGPQPVAPGPGGGCGRNRVALAFLGLFVLIVLFVLAAPLWANDVAETGPNDTHTLEKITVDGEKREVVNPEGQPIGPVWFEAGGKFFLGADGRLGRDEMVRLMYGGQDLALHRPRCGADHDDAGDRPRPARRLLPRLDRRGDRPDRST